MDPKQEYLRIALENIKREGIPELMAWIGSTDFFTAPASTKYHGAYEGGLLMHSLNVYSQLKKLCKFYECEASPESIAIVALFHDLCKIGMYKVEQKWRKNDRNQWEQYPVYVHREDFVYGGHGSKSVYLLMNFIQLTPDEASAINCHMGQYEATQYGNPSAVYERNKLAWLLHVADEAATYITEQEDER